MQTSSRIDWFSIGFNDNSEVAYFLLGHPVYFKFVVHFCGQELLYTRRWMNRWLIIFTFLWVCRLYLICRVACGIIARASGLFENTKRICACSGATLWEERDIAKR